MTKTPSELIADLVSEGGAIVSSGDCHEMEIAFAQACGRFAVDDDGMGFVRRPKDWLDMVSESIKRENEAVV